MRNRTFYHILVCGCIVLGSLVFVRLQQKSILDSPSASQLMASNTYFGPVTPPPGNPQLVRVEILIRDSAEASGLQIVSVEFDHMAIPLKPRDIYGNRGNASFQLKPGSYKLQWTVNRDRFAWPRSVSHEEIVTVSPRDLWLQISIEGEQASIR
jgi:hypothetical protein